MANTGSLILGKSHLHLQIRSVRDRGRPGQPSGDQPSRVFVELKGRAESQAHTIHPAENAAYLFRIDKSFLFLLAEGL